MGYERKRTLTSRNFTSRAFISRTFSFQVPRSGHTPDEIQPSSFSSTSFLPWFYMLSKSAPQHSSFIENEEEIKRPSSSKQGHNRKRLKQAEVVNNTNGDNNNELFCIECQKSFRTSQGLRTHNNQVHVLKLYEKDRGFTGSGDGGGSDGSSGSRSGEVVELSDNRTLVNEFTCDACNKSFTSLTGLQQHTLSKHSGLYKSSKPDWLKEACLSTTTTTTATTHAATTTTTHEEDGEMGGDLSKQESNHDNNSSNNNNNNNNKNDSLSTCMATTSSPPNKSVEVVGTNSCKKESVESNDPAGSVNDQEVKQGNHLWSSSSSSSSSSFESNHDDNDEDGKRSTYCEICGQCVYINNINHIELLQPREEVLRYKCIKCDRWFHEERALKQHLNYCVN
jgi:uncharacterized C2H2 Zn-finger protein